MRFADSAPVLCAAAVLCGESAAFYKKITALRYALMLRSGCAHVFLCESNERSFFESFGYAEVFLCVRLCASPTLRLFCVRLKRVLQEVSHCFTRNFAVLRNLLLTKPNICAIIYPVPRSEGLLVGKNNAVYRTNVLIGGKTMNMAKQVFITATAAIGGVLCRIFGGWDSGMATLIIFMAADYAMGLVVAGVFHSSPKSESGALESRAGWKGLCRKGVTLLVVLIAYRLDIALGTDFIRNAVIIGYIANETISIIENAGLMGVPIPSAVKKAIEMLREREESGGDDGNAQVGKGNGGFNER